MKSKNLNINQIEMIWYLNRINKDVIVEVVQQQDQLVRVFLSKADKKQKSFKCYC